MLLSPLLSFAATSMLFSRVLAQTKCAHGNCEAQGKLFTWISDNGGYVSPFIELSSGNDPLWTVRGLFATYELESGTVLCSLPMEVSLCVTQDIAPSKECALIDFLANEIEKGKSSFYEPYTSLVADQIIDLPAVWNDEEIQLLAGLHPNDWNRHVFWYEHSCGQDVSDVARLRAMLLVVSRSNMIDTYPCLCPVYDIFNHGNGLLQNVHTEMRDDKLTMVTTRKIEKGEQLFSNFGSEHVGRLLRDYGFMSAVPRLWEFESLNEGAQLFWEEYDDNGAIIYSLTEEYESYSVQKMISIYNDLQEQIEQLDVGSPAGVYAPSAEISPSRLALASEFRESYVKALHGAVVALKSYLKTQMAHLDL